MEKYYNVLVEFKEISEKGKIQKIREQFLVLSTGCQESEATVVKHLITTGNNLDYTVTSVKETKTSKVL